MYTLCIYFCPKSLQQRHNILPVKSLRRGGYRFQGRVLNPNEKPIQLSGWAIQTFTKPGSFAVNIWLFFYVGGVVLSLCAGSGSMLEAAMQLGRSCIAVDADGMLHDYPLVLLSLLFSNSIRWCKQAHVRDVWCDHQARLRDPLWWLHWVCDDFIRTLENVGTTRCVARGYSRIICSHMM